MATLKTIPTRASVREFITSVEDENKRRDCRAVMKIMKEVTGKKPVLWGNSIVGYGQYHYKYKSGREGDWMVTGFSPRKQNLTIYIMPGFSNYPDIMDKIGKYKLGSSCLYVKRLADIDTGLLKELVARSVEDMENIYGCTRLPEPGPARKSRSY